jgi:hypothetical protein
MRWSCQGDGAGQQSWGRRWGCWFAARPPPPSCLAEYASVTIDRMLGVTDQDLHRSEASLGKHRCLADVIRAVVAGPPPQAHIVAVMAGGSILLGHGVAPEGMWWGG